MIKHIVMWKLKEEAEGNTKEANAIKMKELLENLKDKIAELKEIEVGINNNPKNEYDILLYSEVDTMEDLEKYQTHPEHVKVGVFVKAVVEKRTCVDYEII